MKGIDLGWLARSLNVPPEKLLYVRDPAAIAALSITLLGMPNVVPCNWYLNACRRVVSDEGPDFDRGITRVTNRTEPIVTIKALRNLIVSARYPTGPVTALLATLSNSDAIDVALGQPFYLDMRKPIREARSVQLERGAGFYYDECLVVRSNHDLAVILVDEASHTLLRKDYREGTRVDFRLAMSDPTAPLW